MHKQLSEQLTSLLTTAMRDAIRSRRLDPARVPFKVHVAERAVNGAVFLGVSFPTLHPRAQIRSTFWGAVARLPFAFRTVSSFERSLDVPVMLPGAEDVAAFEVPAVLRALLGEERYGRLMIEEIHMLLGMYAVEEQTGARWAVTIPARMGGSWSAFGSARFESEAAARMAVKERCEDLLDENRGARCDHVHPARVG